MKKIFKNLIKGKINIDNLKEYKTDILNYCLTIINPKSIEKIDTEDLESVIRLCLDYYTYNDNGDVLIPDALYDKIMNIWLTIGGKQIIYPDALSLGSTWEIMKHNYPGLVGSIKKTYSLEELSSYLEKYRGIKKWGIAPKFDGVSTAITIVDNEIKSAITRGDGFEGQNITEIIKKAQMIEEYWTPFISKNNSNIDGRYKCELVVSQKDFEKLIEEKEYVNRRSATTGIVNSPKNLQYAKYITILPLLHVIGTSNEQYLYDPPGFKIFEIGESKKDNLEKFEKEIMKMLLSVRNSEFPYRVDGVVLFPFGLKLNSSDYMQDSIAYKINTNEALTKVDYGYVSVGRLGNAVPMLKVHPVEVNETIVRDVSLSSFDKFARFDIHEGEVVIVYSAGDVIPQVKLPEQREYKADAPYLKINKICPYCEEKLERFGLEYKCTNQECSRLITGKIINFLSKLGAENISDKTIETLYEHKLIKTIPDIFKLSINDIAPIVGFGEVSANNIVEEINNLKSKEISVSQLFGALGIPNISEKKCRNIFNYITINDIQDGSLKKIRHKILDADNIGIKTAEVFIDFIDKNKYLINFLINTMNISIDKTFKGNVVFTGFRSPDFETRFNKLGYEISDSINSKTAVVVSGDFNHDSTKCKTALKKGINIVDLIDIEGLFKELQKSK